MLNLDWLKKKNYIHIDEKGHRITVPLDNLGIDDAVAFIKRINRMDNQSFPDKPNSLARYSRYGLAITPAYLALRGNNKSKRRRVHPLGMIQYLTTSLLLNGNMISETGSPVSCAKAREADVFYGEICFFVKELNDLRTVLPMDYRDTLNISKIFDSRVLKMLPDFTMNTEISWFEKLHDVYTEEYIKPVYGVDSDKYAAYWAMMYYRAFASCFSRYMPEVLCLSEGY